MSSKSREFLDDIVAFPHERYGGISTTDLLVYAVSQIQDHGVRLSFEAIVVAAYRFFPEAFSLVGFPAFPDASRVGRTLLQCRPKYRGLIRGGASAGFVITELGRARATEVAQRLASAQPSVRPIRRGKPRAIVERIEQEVTDSAAFIAWRSRQSVSEYDFYHFLHLLPGASRESVRANFEAISDAAKDSQYPDVRDFLADLRMQYTKELKQ